MDKTALVTGASSGIGYEFAKILAENKYNLVVVSRSLDKLNEIKKNFEQRYQISVLVFPADLSVPNICEEIYKELTEKKVVIDVLVNNAGFGKHGSYSDQEWETEWKMIQVNLISLTHLTKLFLREMLKRKEGNIINVSSTAAFGPGPFMAVYYAIKAYVLSYSEALANELKGTGVSVTCLCPGQTATGFQKVANVGPVKFGPFLNLAKPDEVACYGFNAMLKGKRVAIPGVINKLMIFSVRFCPRRLMAGFVRYLQEKRKIA